jgi:hypothetical protein
MAANKPVNPMEEMVTVYVPKASGEEPTLFVALNSRTWLLPRGKQSEVPKPVAEIIWQMEKAQAEAEEFAEREKEKMNIIFGAP